MKVIIVLQIALISFTLLCGAETKQFSSEQRSQNHEPDPEDPEAERPLMLIADETVSDSAEERQEGVIISSKISNVSEILEVEEDTDAYGTLSPDSDSDEPEFYLTKPKNLKLELEGEDEDTLLLKWSFDDGEPHTGFQVQLDMLEKSREFEIEYYNEDKQNSLLSSKSLSFFTEEKIFRRSLKALKLTPGMTYKATVFTQLDSKLSLEGAEINFTMKPNAPVRFVVWYRNETSFLVLWQPPTNGVFDRYRTEISPRESPESVLLVSQLDYQFGGVRPGFFNLTPGKAYNISVVTESESMTSNPLIKEYRTMPMRPQNISVEVMDLKVALSTILVEWEPPTIGEYDGWNVYIKKQWGKQMQKFVSKIKPPRAHLHEASLEFGESYEVVVKTVSGKVSSFPSSFNFTYLPKDYIV